jgi:hypothetical protein
LQSWSDSPVLPVPILPGLSCPDCPFLAILFFLSCPGRLLQAALSSHLVPAVQFCLYCLPISFRQSCSACPGLPSLSFFACSVPTLPFWRCRASGPVLAVPCWLFPSSCPVLAILSFLLCPGSLIPVALSSLSSCQFLAILSFFQRQRIDKKGGRQDRETRGRHRRQDKAREDTLTPII